MKKESYPVLIPLLDIKSEMKPIDLMPGISFRKLVLPADWPNTSATTFLIIDNRHIVPSRYYRKKDLNEYKILNAFYAYCFLRSDLEVNVDNFKNARYVCQFDDIDEFDKAELLRCDDSFKFESNPFLRGMSTIWAADELVHKLYEASDQFPKYLAYRGASNLSAKGAKGHSPLYIARQSIEAGFAEHQWSDELQIISIFAAFEALFSRDSYEVSFKLAHNIAYFLYPGQRQHEERLQFIRKFRHLYDFRSKVAHGTRTSLEGGIEYEEIMSLMRTVMRKVIEDHALAGEFLNAKYHKDFIERLQAGCLLFEGSKRLGRA